MWFPPGSNSNNRKMCLVIFNNMDIITVSWINGVDFCQWICMECFFFQNMLLLVRWTSIYVIVSSIDVLCQWSRVLIWRLLCS